MTKEPRFRWEIDETHPEYNNDLIEGLAGILDPELGFSVIELGMVRDISIKDGEALVVMILTTPFCPYGPAMLEETRKKVEDILGMPTEIQLGSTIWDPSMMDKDLQDPEWGLFP